MNLGKYGPRFSYPDNVYFLCGVTFDPARAAIRYAAATQQPELVSLYNENADDFAKRVCSIGLPFVES